MNVVGQSLIVHVVTLRGGGINAWQIHQFWSPARPNKYSFLGPIPGVYILYIHYIGRDIRGPTTAKAGTRQKGKPTNPTSNLWISFSLVCSSPNPFESLKKNYCTYPLMTQTLFRFGDLSSNLCPTLQIDTPAKKNTYQVCLFFYIGLANQD